MISLENEYVNQFAKGNLMIVLSRPSLFPGEVISGNVHMNLFAPLVPGFRVTAKLYVKQSLVELPSIYSMRLDFSDILRREVLLDGEPVELFNDTANEGLAAGNYTY